MKDPCNRLLSDALVSAYVSCPERLALVCEKQSHSYRELYETSLDVANWLLETGFRRGDRVAIYMDNTWECVCAIYGTLLAGGVFFVVNPQVKKDKLSFLLNNSEATATERLSRKSRVDFQSSLNSWFRGG